MACRQGSLTCILDALSYLVYIWNCKGKVAKASPEIVVVNTIVLCQLKGKVGVFRAKAQEGIRILVLQ